MESKTEGSQLTDYHQLWSSDTVIHRTYNTMVEKQTKTLSLQYTHQKTIYMAIKRVSTT
jgi:hypothetical protein